MNPLGTVGYNCPAQSHVSCQLQFSVGIIANGGGLAPEYWCLGDKPSGDGGTLCDLCVDGPGGDDGNLMCRFFFDGLFDGLIDRRVRCFFSDGLIDGQGPGRALAAGLVSYLLTSSSPKIASNGNC